MYGASPDPYCYPGTSVLRNRLGIRDPDTLEAFETASTLTSLFVGLKRDRFLRGLSRHAFAREGARFLTTLNAIHPFREGNGRSQLTFMAALANAADHPFALDRLVPRDFLKAMIESFHGREANLVRQVGELIE